VNETGTEAAAATDIEFRCYVFMPVEKPKFVADHPFAYMLNGGRMEGSLLLFNGTYSG
jgi:serine protease inhibitor